MRIRRVGSCFSALCMLLVILLSPVAMFSMPRPVVEEITAATVTSSTGAANFKIPIEVPPGPGGLGPELSLRYSSRSGDGPVGLGWRIQPLGEIRCSARFGVPDYASCPRYELDGELLTEDPANPGRFHTFVERFKRITRHVAGRYAGSWEVVLPTGTILRYGLDAASRIHADGSVASWHLSEVESPFGPRVLWSYTDDPAGGAGNGGDLGVLYPLHVSWAEGTRSIDFHYETRPDPIHDFRSGVERHIGSRQREVEVRSNGNIYQRRVMGYAALGSYTTGRSRLAWVQVFGTDCTAPNAVANCQGLPRREFDYTDAPAAGGAGVQWVEETGYEIPLGGNVHIGEPPQHMGDIDGDGLVDRLVAGEDLVGAEYVDVLLNTGTGFAWNEEWSTAFQNLTTWVARVDVRQIETLDPADFWWESGGLEAGVCEFVASALNPEAISVKFPTRSRPHVRFNPLPNTNVVFDSHLEARGRWMLTDLDGDGRADLVMSMRMTGTHVTLDCADGLPITPVEPVEGATDLEDDPAEVSTYASGRTTFKVTTTSSSAAGAEWRSGSETGPGGLDLSKPSSSGGGSILVGDSGGQSIGAAFDGATGSAGVGASASNALLSVADIVGAEGAAQIEALIGDDSGDGWIQAFTDTGCFASHTDPDMIKELGKQGTAAAAISVVVVGSVVSAGTAGAVATRAAGAQAINGAAMGFMQGQDLGNGVATALPKPSPRRAGAAGFWVGFAGGVANSRLGK